MRWRESRPRILAEAVDWEEGEEGMGTLCVEGVVRGARFSADRLVTLQGFGDFMLEKVRPLPPSWLFLSRLVGLGRVLMRWELDHYCDASDSN